VVPLETVEIRIDTGDWVLVNGTTNWSISVNVTDLPGGNHTLEVRAWDGYHYGMSETITFVVETPPDPKRADLSLDDPLLEDPIVLTVTFGSFSILLLALVAVTEPGKYWLGLLGAPLFTRTDDVLDSKTRNAILGTVVTNPGIHYSALREEVGLSNGATAHHLHLLEREGFIRSVRDGRLKRFYSVHTKIPEDVGRSPEGTREAIVDLVGERPGISQLGVMEELGLDRDSASYYLRELVKAKLLKSRKDGWYTVYTITDRK
jgi:predicted transcriptional regulator